MEVAGHERAGVDGGWAPSVPGLGVAARAAGGSPGVSLPTLLAACGGAEAPRGGETDTPDTRAPRQGKPILRDVLDHALSSKEWSGAFGFITLRLHRGTVDGSDVWFVRTDTSDKAYTAQERLVGAQAGARTARQPGRRRLPGQRRTRRPADGAVVTARPCRLRGGLAAAPGGLEAPAPAVGLGRPGAGRPAGRPASVIRTDIVLDAAVVKWSSGAMPVDDQRTEYLDPGQLLEAPDTTGMQVMFSCTQCSPGCATS